MQGSLRFLGLTEVWKSKGCLTWRNSRRNIGTLLAQSGYRFYYHMMQKRQGEGRLCEQPAVALVFSFSLFQIPNKIYSKTEVVVQNVDNSPSGSITKPIVVNPTTLWDQACRSSLTFCITRKPERPASFRNLDLGCIFDKRRSGVLHWTS